MSNPRDQPKESKTGMLLGGIFSAELIDSSGETVELDGIDISSAEEGTATVNWEHVDAETGFGKETIGRVIYVKKIFKKGDCETTEQEKF